MNEKSQIYIFSGSDEIKVKESTLQILNKLIKKFNIDETFGIESFNAKVDNLDQAIGIIDQIVESIQTISIFSEWKIICINNVNFFDDSQLSKSKILISKIELLVDLLSSNNFPNNIFIILNATKIDKRKTVFKKLNELSSIKTFDQIDISKYGWEEKVFYWVKERANELNLKFDDKALELFVFRIGPNTSVLINELNKLSTYLGENHRVIQKNDIKNIVSESSYGIIFEIGDAIVRRDLSLSLNLIDKYLLMGESSIGILLAGIIPKIRNLFYAKVLKEIYNIGNISNYSEFQYKIKSLMELEYIYLPKTAEGKISFYPIFLVYRFVNNFQINELRDFLKYCLEANQKLVSSSSDDKLILSQLMFKIMA